MSDALGAYVASFCNIIAESGGPANIPLARKCITSTAQPLTEPHIHQTFPTSAHRNMARVAWFPRSTPAASWPRPGVQACVESWCMERGETSPRAQRTAWTVAIKAKPCCLSSIRFRQRIEWTSARAHAAQHKETQVSEVAA